MARFPQLPLEAVVFDTEFTAWEGSMVRRWMAPGEYREIVQIAGLRVGTGDWQVRNSFHILVRPRINSLLSAYFEKLTGIRNADVADQGVDFEIALRRFLEFVGGAPTLSFGGDDAILAENIRLYGLKNAAPPPCLNVVSWFAKHGLPMRGTFSCDVARLAGVPFEGRLHDARDDAMSVALGIRAFVERGIPSPLAEQVSDR
jgi:inhibitor of KinA sporulation pathway (predicted exonuclease)